MGREITQDAGPNGPLSRTRARSGQRPPIPRRPPAQLPLRHFSRSCLAHSPLAAQTPWGAGRGQRESGLGSGRRGSLPQGPGEPPSPPPRPGPWARPAPVAAASSLGTLGAAHRSGAGSDHVASSSPGCKLTERGTTPAAATPPLACAGSGPRWWASPPLRAPRSDSHRLPCAPNCREASRPPREVRRRAGSAQDAAPTAGDEGVGKEAEGYGTNGLDAPSQAHRSSDPEGAGPEPRAAPAPGTD